MIYNEKQKNNGGIDGNVEVNKILAEQRFIMSHHDAAEAEPNPPIVLSYPILSYSKIEFGISNHLVYQLMQTVGWQWLASLLKAYKEEVWGAALVLGSAYNTLVEATDDATAAPIVTPSEIEFGISEDLSRRLTQMVNGIGQRALTNYVVQVRHAAVLLRTAYNKLLETLRHELHEKKMDFYNAKTMVDPVNEAQKAQNVLYLDVGGTDIHTSPQRADLPQYLRALVDPELNSNPELTEDGKHFVDRDGSLWPRVVWPNPHRLADLADLHGQQLREHKYANADLLDLAKEFQNPFSRLLPYIKDGQFEAKRQQNHRVMTVKPETPGGLQDLTDLLAEAVGGSPLKFTFRLKQKWQEMDKDDQSVIQASYNTLRDRLQGHNLSVGYLAGHVYESDGEEVPVLEITFPYSPRPRRS